MRIPRIIKWLIYFLLISGAASGGFAVARWPRTIVESHFEVPSLVHTQPGRLTVVHCESPAKICWHVCQTSAMPDVLPLDDGKTLVFVAATAGRYELVAWTAIDGSPTEAARCIVQVEGSKPIDPLADLLRTAWAKETNPNRIRYRDALVNVYRTGADDLVNRSATIGELYSALRRTAQTVLPDDALPNVRGAISDVLKQRLPIVDASMTDDLRKKCSETFRAIAEALVKLEVSQVSTPVNCKTCR
jgi:hypothetical protein